VDISSLRPGIKLWSGLSESCPAPSSLVYTTQFCSHHGGGFCADLGNRQNASLPLEIVRRPKPSVVTVALVLAARIDAEEYASRRVPLADIKCTTALASLRRAIECDTYDSQTTSRNQQKSKSQPHGHFIFKAKYTCGDGDEENHCGYAFHC
jgi:hypothetical protein